MPLGNRFLLRLIRVRPRLASAAAVGIAIAAALSMWAEIHIITALLIGWNAGACLYIVLAGVMMARSNQESMQRRAGHEDDGQLVILMLVVLAAVASLSAIIAELVMVKDMTGPLRYAHIGLAVLTIFASWAFTHLMFALHYAHDYYVARVAGRAGGLDFPNDDAPDYADFLYFAFIIGTSAQTADVSISSKAMRRVGLVHSVLSFIFNTTLLALTINIAASMF